MIRLAALLSAFAAVSSALAVEPVRLRPLLTADGDHPIHARGEHEPTGHDAVRDAREHPRHRPAHFDVLHYDLDIAADPATGVVSGVSTVTFASVVAGLGEVSLDAVDMQIEDVRDASGARLAFTYDGQVLIAALPRALARGEQGVVAVRYKALAPQRLYRTGPDATDRSRMTAAYTYTQPEGSPHWYPCLDRPSDKATLTIAVTVPEGQRALSNGVPVSESIGPEGHRFVYRMEQPIATYLVSLALGAYETHTLGTYKGKPLTVWTPPTIAAQSLAEVRRTEQMLQIFEEFTGVDYPYDVYAQSVAEAYRGSMEHQAATTMGGARMSGDGTGESVVAHELAHQWFGDWVTCRVWGQLWLNEGFATYLPHIFFDRAGDANRALGEVTWWRSGYFGQARTRVHPLSEVDPDINGIFDSHSYEKGGLVIRMMHWLADRMPVVNAARVGEPPAASTFTEALRHYLTVNGGGTVTDESLQRSLEHVTGQSWQMFFDHWVRSAGHPQLAVRYEADAVGTTLVIEQTQATRDANRWRAFTVALPLELHFADGKRQERIVDLYEKVQTVRLPAGVVAVAVDPEWRIPAEVEVLQGADAWRTVLTGSPHAPARIVATRALAALDPATLDGAALAALARDPMPLVTAEAIASLTGDKANRVRVHALYDALAARDDLDVPSHGVVYDTERWLVQTLDELPTREQQDIWRRRFARAELTSERRALAQMLAHADREAAHRFILERMATTELVTLDEINLLDVLTLTPSPAADAWLRTMIEEGIALTYFNRAVRNLKTAGYDRPEIVPGLLAQAKGNAYLSSRGAAIELLGAQASSKDVVCPELDELARAGEDAQRPAAFAGVRAAAEAARLELACGAR